MTVPTFRKAINARADELINRQVRELQDLAVNQRETLMQAFIKQHKNIVGLSALHDLETLDLLERHRVEFKSLLEWALENESTKARKN